MAQGITITSDAKVTIDLKKYGEQLMDFLRSVGVEKKAEKVMYKPNKRTIEAIRDAKNGKTIKFESLDSFMDWARNV